MANQPDFEQILVLWWGGAYESTAFAAFQAAAANVIVGTNPPYTLSDFLAVYPKFFGTPTPIGMTLISNSSQATLSANPPDDFVAGVFVNCVGLPNGTTVVAVEGTTVRFSNLATLSGDVTVNAYLAPFLPIIVIQMFATLASASLVQRRWGATWPLGMALYIAHFCTLWLQTEGGPNSTAAQVASSGLQQGILISQAAGDVSASTQPVTGLENWGAWNLTEYGAQLATFAKVIGAGMMWIM